MRASELGFLHGYMLKKAEVLPKTSEAPLLTPLQRAQAARATASLPATAGNIMGSLGGQQLPPSEIPPPSTARIGRNVLFDQLQDMLKATVGLKSHKNMTPTDVKKDYMHTSVLADTVDAAMQNASSDQERAAIQNSEVARWLADKNVMSVDPKVLAQTVTAGGLEALATHYVPAKMGQGALRVGLPVYSIYKNLTGLWPKEIMNWEAAQRAHGDLYGSGAYQYMNPAARSLMAGDTLLNQAAHPIRAFGDMIRTGLQNYYGDNTPYHAPERDQLNALTRKMRQDMAKIQDPAQRKEYMRNFYQTRERLSGEVIASQLAHGKYNLGPIEQIAMAAPEFYRFLKDKWEGQRAPASPTDPQGRQQRIENFQEPSVVKTQRAKAQRAENMEQLRARSKERPWSAYDAADALRLKRIQQSLDPYAHVGKRPST